LVPRGRGAPARPARQRPAPRSRGHVLFHRSAREVTTVDRDQTAIEGAKDYARLVAQWAPKPNVPLLISRAFLVGGSICFAGQFVFDYFRQRQPTEVEAIALTLATMISAGVLLTALGVYDHLGELGGMGAAVPITGFANSMAAAAIDFRREGMVLGMAAKMFVIAGPVIVYGIVAGILTGLVATLLRLAAG